MVPVALQLVTGGCQHGNTDIHLDQIHLQNVLSRAVSSSTITHDDYQDTGDDGRFDSVPVLYPIGMEYVIKKTITEQSWAKLTHTRRNWGTLSVDVDAMSVTTPEPADTVIAKQLP